MCEVQRLLHSCTGEATKQSNWKQKVGVVSHQQSPLLGKESRKHQSKRRDLPQGTPTLQDSSTRGCCHYYRHYYNFKAGNTVSYGFWSLTLTFHAAHGVYAIAIACLHCTQDETLYMWTSVSDELAGSEGSARAPCLSWLIATWLKTTLGTFTQAEVMPPSATEQVAGKKCSNRNHNSNIIII